MLHDFGPWRPDAHHLYPFRFWDEVAGKWVRARYVAEFPEIAARYQQFQIIGPPELRSMNSGGHFPTPAQQP